MYLNSRADCCPFLPNLAITCLPLSTCAPANLCLAAFWHSSQPPSCSQQQLPQQPQPTPSAPSKGGSRPRPSSSLATTCLPTYLLPNPYTFANTTQHTIDRQLPPLPPLWFSPPFLAGQRGRSGAGLPVLPFHLTCNHPSPVSAHLHIFTSSSFRGGAAEPCALCLVPRGSVAEWIPEVSISEPPSTRPKPRKTLLGLCPRGWHWHTRLSGGTHRLLAVSPEPVLLSPTRR